MGPGAALWSPKEEHEVTRTSSGPSRDRNRPEGTGRMNKERIGDAETVSGEVRKEHIDAESDIEEQRSGVEPSWSASRQSGPRTRDYGFGHLPCG